MKVLIAFSMGSDFDVTKKLWFRFTRSMGWCFALINGKLAEIFFDQKKNVRIFFGHAYVKESDYKSKREKVWIEKDTKKCQFSYRKGIYKSADGTIYKCMDLQKRTTLKPCKTERSLSCPKQF